MKYSLPLGCALGLALIIGSSCMGASSIDPNSSIQAIEATIRQESATTGFVPLSRFLSFFSKINFPDDIKNIFNKIQIGKPDIKVSTSGLQIKGSALFNQLQISLDIGIYKTATQPQIHVELLLPKGAKPSDLISKLSKLDFIELDASGFIFSNYAYTEDDTQVNVTPGITFKAAINLDTIIEKIRQKIDIKAGVSQDEFKKSLSKFFVTDKLSVWYSGHVSLTLDEVTGRLEIPLQFGLDFTALKKKKDGTNVFDDPLITKITLSRIFAEINVKQGQLSVTLALGVNVYPKTQVTPLEFQARGTFEQSGIKIGGLMKGAFDPAFGLKWLALGAPELPAGIELFFDNVISPSFIVVCGVPLPSGISITGGLGIGKGEYRTTAQGVISLELKTAGLSSFIFSGKIDQIHVSRLIQVLASLSDKKLDIGKDIPQILFKDMELTVAPFGGQIFDTKFDAEFQASAGLQVGTFKGGGTLALGITPTAPRLMVEAYIENLEVKLPKCKVLPEGGLLFALTGLGKDLKLGTADDRALLKIDVAVGKPIDQQVFAIDAALKIPPLQFFGGLYFVFQGNKISGGGEGSFFNGKFTAKTDLSLSFTDPQDFEFACALHNDFTPYLCEKLKEGFVVFKQNALDAIAQYDKELQQVQTNFATKSDAEKVRVAKKIVELEAELKRLNPPDATKLDSALAGGTTLHVSNHTNTPLYVAMYTVNKDTKQSERSGSILELSPYIKNQIKRPALPIGERRSKDRDMFVSRRKFDLKAQLTEHDYYTMARKHVGGTYAKFHIIQEKLDMNMYNGPEWTMKYGDDLARITAELVSFRIYRKALLKPGTIALNRVIESIRDLKAVPLACIKFADKVMPLLDKALQFVTLKEASLSTAGKDLTAGKLPMVTLKFDINVDGKKISIDLEDVQLDLANAEQFFVDMAIMIASQTITQ